MTERAHFDGDVVAMVLTHNRPRLAGRAVRNLLESEQIEPGHVVLVINGRGGLDDPGLEQLIRIVRLEENTGPAGGFAAGLQFFLENYDSPWLYLSEDDVTLSGLPVPRIRNLVTRTESWAGDHDAARLGAVVAYGRDLNVTTGITTAHHPRNDTGFEPVDVAPWGASLISRSVVEHGVRPDPEWFFGYEDFDFWLQMRSEGFLLMLDTVAACAATENVFGAGRDSAFIDERPDDTAEPWRAYYVARNFVHLARKHGHPVWILWHTLKSVRRIQLARNRVERRAIVAGFFDGIRGRTGRVDRYVRSVGEYDRAND